MDVVTAPYSDKKLDSKLHTELTRALKAQPCHPESISQRAGPGETTSISDGHGVSVYGRNSGRISNRGHYDPRSVSWGRRYERQLWIWTSCHLLSLWISFRRSEYPQRRWSVLGEQLIPPFARQVSTAYGDREATRGTRRLDIPAQAVVHEGLNAATLLLRTAVLTLLCVPDGLEQVRLHPTPKGTGFSAEDGRRLRDTDEVAGNRPDTSRPST